MYSTAGYRGVMSGVHLLLDVDVVVLVVLVEVHLARGQHGHEEVLDQARLLLRVLVLA